MAQLPKYGRYPARLDANAKLLAFEIDGGSGTPAVATNGNRLNVIDTDTGLTDTGTGVITVPLKEKFHDVWPLSCNIETATGNEKVEAVYDGTVSPPTITLYVYDTDATAALADTSKKIHFLGLGFMNGVGAS